MEKKMRKTLHFICSVMICLSVFTAVPASAYSSGDTGFKTIPRADSGETVLAASYRNKLVKVGIKGSDPADYDYYYYDANGKKLTNAWKTIRQGGNNYRFYFGKNGKACKAKKDGTFKYNVAIHTIKGIKYGFDVNGRMVTGVWINASFDRPYFYYFNADGKFNAARSQALRTAAKKGAPASGLKNLLKKYVGKPKSTLRSGACTIYKGQEPLYATIVRYQRLEIQYYKMPDGKEIVYIAIGALR